MIDVGKMIAKIRLERGYSQYQLAEKLNMSKQAISNYENGKREPNYMALEAIADALNVPMTMLISPEDQKRALNEIYETYPGDKNINSIGHALSDVMRDMSEAGQKDVLQFARFILEKEGKERVTHDD